MLMDRIIKALTFKKEVYAEVEHDESFTGTAWILVAVVAFLNQLGSLAGSYEIGDWIIATIVGTLVAVIGFAVGAYVIAWVGKSLFQAEVTFEEVVRAVGLAYVWNIVGAAGILLAVAPGLTCLLGLPLIIGAFLGLYSSFIAVREALDLETGQTLITVALGFLAIFIVSALTSSVLGLIGLGAAAVSGAF